MDAHQTAFPGPVKSASKVGLDAHPAARRRPCRRRRPALRASRCATSPVAEEGQNNPDRLNRWGGYLILLRPALRPGPGCDREGAAGQGGRGTRPRGGQALLQAHALEGGPGGRHRGQAAWAASRGSPASRRIPGHPGRSGAQTAPGRSRTPRRGDRKPAADALGRSRLCAHKNIARMLRAECATPPGGQELSVEGDPGRPSVGVGQV